MSPKRVVWESEQEQPVPARASEYWDSCREFKELLRLLSGEVTLAAFVVASRKHPACTTIEERKVERYLVGLYCSMDPDAIINQSN